MKKLFIYILLLQSTFVFCQENNSDFEKKQSDTIFWEDTDYYKNGKLKSIKYTYRDPYSGVTKEELFMRGLPADYNNKIDSIKIYNYNKDWKLIEEKVLLENIIFKASPLANDEYNLLDRLIKIEGKANRRKIINLKAFESDLFTIENENKNIIIEQISDSIISLEIIPNFELSIFIEPGIHTYDLYIEGENQIRKRMMMKVVGYDIASSDFYKMKTQAKDNALKIKSLSEVYIEKEENEHLLRIRKEEDGKLIIIPTSKIVNKLDLKSFGTGEFLLELTNLKTTQKKYCKIIVE